jgi:hypothetical protein
VLGISIAFKMSVSSYNTVSLLAAKLLNPVLTHILIVRSLMKAV